MHSLIDILNSMPGKFIAVLLIFFTMLLAYDAELIDPFIVTIRRKAQRRELISKKSTPEGSHLWIIQ